MPTSAKNQSSKSKAPRDREPFRRTWLGKQTALPALRMLGRDQLKQLRPSALLRHDHGRAYEICYLRAGQVDWWFESSRRNGAATGTDTPRRLLEVSAGQVSVTPPQTAHGGLGNALQPCELMWAIIDANFVARALDGQPFCDTPAVTSATSDVTSAFTTLFDLHEKSATPLTRPATRVAMMRLVIAIATTMQHKPPSSRSLRLALESAGRGEDVEQQARAAGISVSCLHARLRSELGLTPAAVARRHRITRAKHLLAGSETVTVVAQQCGYSSSQSFATTFRREVGMTPTAYRDAVL
ncbi:MAG: helix-turn-helix transcriptional regulator [Planctomycetota bacterium]